MWRVIGLCVAITMAEAHFALAQDADNLQAQWDHCQDRNGKFTNSQRIDACTTVVQASGITEEARSRAFFYRGGAHQLRGMFNHDQSELRLAIADYDQALQANADWDTALRDRAAAHDLLGEYEDAIADLNRVIERHPSDPLALVRRCAARANLNRELDQALSDCNAALQVRPNEPLILQDRGWVYLRRQMYAEALSDYDAAFRTNADLVESLYGRGIAEMRLGRRVQADADITAATARDPHIAQQFAALGISP